MTMSTEHTVCLVSLVTTLLAWYAIQCILDATTEQHLLYKQISDIVRRYVGSTHTYVYTHLRYAFLALMLSLKTVVCIPH